MFLCGEVTLYINYMANTDWTQDAAALNTSVYPKDDPCKSQTHINSWFLLILIMNIPKKALPWSAGGSFLFGTSEDPLSSFTVSPKSTHSLPIGPDLHMKCCHSFCSTLAPLSAHMPGSEEAGKARNWSVSLGWKVWPGSTPPWRLQGRFNVQVYTGI